MGLSGIVGITLRVLEVSLTLPAARLPYPDLAAPIYASKPVIHHANRDVVHMDLDHHGHLWQYDCCLCVWRPFHRQLLDVCCGHLHVIALLPYPGLNQGSALHVDRHNRS